MEKQDRSKSAKTAGSSRRRYWTLCAILLVPGWLFASDEHNSAGPSHDTSAIPSWRLRVLDLGLDTRFNYMDREAAPVTDRNLQYRLRTKVRLDLRENGGTYFIVRAETGRGFDNSWNNTGKGLGDGQLIFNVKSIALHQKFGSRLEAEAGGLEFDRGAGTDAIYASDDGHMTGYRAALSRGGSRWPDRISFTAGYAGDFEKPNYFSRLRMDQVNYLQFLVQQHFTERIEASAEADRIHGIAFGRGAVQFRKLWVFDRAVLEAAGRGTGGFRFSWSSTVSHAWGGTQRWRSDLIYADLPPAYYEAGQERALLNRGEIDLGKRLAAGMTYRLTEACEIGIFGGRLLDSAPSKRWVAQAGISYQFSGIVNRLLR